MPDIESAISKHYYYILLSQPYAALIVVQTAYVNQVVVGVTKDGPEAYVIS